MATQHVSGKLGFYKTLSKKKTKLKMMLGMHPGYYLLVSSLTSYDSEVG